MVLNIPWNVFGLRCYQIIKKKTSSLIYFWSEFVTSRDENSMLEWTLKNLNAFTNVRQNYRTIDAVLLA